MSSDRQQPGWDPLTAVARPEGYRLDRALVTTFGPPDPGVLSEDYLPAWLGLHNGYAEQGSDRMRYFAELEYELKRLKQRITVVSSAGDAGSAAEGWIWPYIHRLEVGAGRSAVQHAKLWLFHWVGTAGEEQSEELIELVISSANLTRSGLRDQLQSGWRCRVPLARASTASRRSAWGVLPGFLEALAVSSKTSFAEWLELLGRAQAPDDVSFVASVPGTHTRATLARASTRWGVEGLRKQLAGTKPRLGVMAPTIGKWNDASLRAWCEAAGVEPERLSVAWIGPVHAWSADWQLDEPSERALTAAGASWLEISDPNRDPWESAFTDDQPQSDRRWSHAKLYDLRYGRYRALLVTSANFSQSAWGAPDPDNGSVTIKNFELGVVLPVRDGFLGRLDELSGERHVTAVQERVITELPIAWAAASWDGSSISIECRLRDEDGLRPEVGVRAARAIEPAIVTTRWVSGQLHAATIPWPVSTGVPLAITVMTEGGESREIAIADIRVEPDDAYVNPEFDEDELRDLAVALLEERYGYVPPGDGDGAGGSRGSDEGDGVVPTSYSVAAYEDARRRFRLIDNWARELESESEHGRRTILSDGDRIATRWEQQAGDDTRREPMRITARIAVEELRRRLEAH